MKIYSELKQRKNRVFPNRASKNVPPGCICFFTLRCFDECLSALFIRERVRAAVIAPVISMISSAVPIR